MRFKRLNARLGDLWFGQSENQAPTDVEIILSKSMPRSGHHFLGTLLRSYFGSDFHYCEFYSPEDCCRRIPCSKPRAPGLTNHYFMQKSHDFSLSDRKLTDFKHVIQYRHPVSRSQSNFDLAVQRGLRRDSRRASAWFMRAEARYFIRFYRKWIEKSPPRALPLTYESLVGRPEASLTGVIKFMTDGEVSTSRVSQVIENTAQLNVQTREPHEPRKITDHRFYDEDLCRRIEEKVFAACPGLSLTRYFL